jgi:amino acid transporter
MKYFYPYTESRFNTKCLILMWLDAPSEYIKYGKVLVLLSICIPTILFGLFLKYFYPYTDRNFTVMVHGIAKYMVLSAYLLLLAVKWVSKPQKIYGLIGFMVFICIWLGILLGLGFI